MQPEVPVYVWKEDVLWAELPKRIEQADIYTRKLESCVAQNEAQAAELCALKALVAAQKATLLFMQQGQLAKAEAQQVHARQLETALSEMLSLFSWPKVEQREVYNRATQVSRYDAVDENRGTVQVCCAFSGCRKPQTLEFSRTNSWYTPSCPACGRTFLVFVARLKDFQMEKKRGHMRYVLRLEDAQNKNVQVQFVDGSGDIWQVIQRDYLALLYTWHLPSAPQTKNDAELSAVVNLTRKHVFWLSKVGPCFVATAFLGEEAVELSLFRRFRDEVLLQSFWGRQAVKSYYALGPWAVRFLRMQPWLKTPIRRCLRYIHRQLQTRMGEAPPNDAPRV